MKKASKFLVYGLCLSMLASMFGCSSKPKSKLEEIKAKGYIVWGTNAAFTPFEYKDSNGNVVGVDADIAKAVADAIGVQLKVEDMEFDSLPAALASGKIDFIVAGYTKNDERMQTMDFSSEYYTAVQVVAVKDGSKINTKDDLKGKKIGVQNGTTGDLYVASDIEGADVQRYNSLTLACQDLKNGKLDCVIGDNLPIDMILKQISGLSVVKSIVYDNENYAIAVKKGDTELLNQINSVLNKMITDGTINEKLKTYSTAE